jgi:hypothetical protein
MVATVRTSGESNAFTASPQIANAGAGGFVSFVSPACEFVRTRRMQTVVPAASQSVDVRRFVLDQGEDYHLALADNPALLTGLLPYEAPRWLAIACELGSDNYIG